MAVDLRAIERHASHAKALKRRALILTADDFGLHPRVNLAVEQAHCDGVLAAASLMVGAPAAADALARARALPSLRVGLHLVLADGDAVMPREGIAALVDEHGRFGSNMVRDGVRFFFLPHVREQLAREIRAQFEAFAKTGLVLDHVNTHKHFHLHPTVLGLILEIGREFGMKAMRLPFEANAPLWLKPWIAQVRARLDRAGICHNDYVIGIARSGRMDEAAWLAALAALPDGVGEIYCHPAVPGERALTDGMRDYRHADEFAALLSPDVARAIRHLGVRVGGFSDVFGDVFVD
ncbi:hopanoid biosynthesis-associated protein HpnK [Paraburkholderia phenoliruptrix]|uniref:Hopanoid biosynthesis associated protein HpnK n=2 Tax=Paraburkholderia phenoliruptrix TaxID=252970 RepID=K0DHX4_9BURK|nr:hopanoid biosynthesis-associated protein HpnK [Paraburkholderia phenoliruptrix]AFT85651.1 hopanoid biosynthesis associated protein HpnK [Paraburkholderia phenoliruptrix BR3459a]MDR6421755.1 hopanoid biosynthesis associated protein HpnK [Paraburkholderia phenoliruptrix]CAB4048169.1 Carbohydrate deacetylase [Paraburkholderia phenoliruptrix]